MTAIATATEGAELERTEDPKLAAALVQVRQLAGAALDAVIPQEGLRMQASTPEQRAAGADPVVFVAATQGDEHMRLRVLEGAHEQIADKLDINLPYYRKMLAEEPSLLAANVNRWLHRAPAEPRLLRMVRPLPGQDVKPFEASGAPLAVRAYLSDAYKVVDHYSVLQVLAPELTERNAVLDEWHLSDRRFSLKVTTPTVDIGALLQPGRHDFVNEVVAIGIHLSNSETGHGSCSVEVFVRILRCNNGLIVDEALRLVHLGKRQEADATWMQSDTRRLVEAADVLKIRDKVRAGFSDEGRVKVAERIAEATGMPLAGRIGSTPFMEFVANVGARFDLSRAEQAALQEQTLAELVQDQRLVKDATRWNLSQGFTALARETADYERKVELERIGWKVIADPLQALLKAGKAAQN